VNWLTVERLGLGLLVVAGIVIASGHGVGGYIAALLVFAVLGGVNRRAWTALPDDLRPEPSRATPPT
jgi:hypothetical protein